MRAFCALRFAMVSPFYADIITDRRASLTSKSSKKLSEVLR
jgi:hypothetical protein